MIEDTDRDMSEGGKGGDTTDGLPSETLDASSPVVIQKLSPVRQTYSFPGSVAKSDVYSRFRIVTEDMMNEAMAEAKRSFEDRHGIIRKGKASTAPSGRFLESDMSKAHFEKVVKQIKWFWFEIEDYLREIETTYNEIRLHNENFEPRKRDKEEDVKRHRRVAEFNARSCRIVYDLQQQTKEVFSFIDKHDNRLNKINLKKLHSIHRGVVSSLHNLLTRLPDYDLERGLPPVYHQLAMLIRRLAQCCFELEFGQDIHIIRNLETIRQKVETADKPEVHDLPLYKLTSDVKRPSCPTTKPCPKGKGPLVWQEYDAHNKGKRPPGEVPKEIMDLIDLSTGQGYIAPVQLQSGIERFLRMKSPRKDGQSKLGTAFKIPAIGARLAAVLGDQSNLTDEKSEAVTRSWNKLRHEFVSEVEREIKARLQPMLQQAQKVVESQTKKTYKVAHVHVDPPTDALMRLQEAYWKLQDPLLRLQDNQGTPQSEEYMLKQKAKMNEVLGYLTKFDNEFSVRDKKVMMLNSDKLSGQGDVPYAVPKTNKRKRRTRSPVTISKPRSDKSHILLGSPCSDRIIKPKTLSGQKSPRKGSSQIRRSGSSPKDIFRSQGFDFGSDSSSKIAPKSGKESTKVSKPSGGKVPKWSEEGLGRSGMVKVVKETASASKAFEIEGKVKTKRDEEWDQYEMEREDEEEEERKAAKAKSKSKRPVDEDKKKKGKKDKESDDKKDQRRQLLHKITNEEEEEDFEGEEDEEYEDDEYDDDDKKGEDKKLEGKGYEVVEMQRPTTAELGVTRRKSPESGLKRSDTFIADDGGKVNGEPKRSARGRNGMVGDVEMAPPEMGKKYSSVERIGMGDVGKKGVMKTYGKPGPSARNEALVYMMQEDRPPSGGGGSIHMDDDDKKSTPSPRPPSKKSTQAVSQKDGEDLQWALQGSLTLWSPNQVEEMLDKVKEMEEEEQMIRRRWQDLLYVDPAIKGLGSNYRIAYGEQIECGENKEPDAVVLMKPSMKTDTIVMVTALPPPCDEHSTEGITPKHSLSPMGQTPRLYTPKSGSQRSRGGWDISSSAVSLQFSSSYLSAITDYCGKFDQYLQKTSHYAVGDFDPWKVIEDVSDDILNDLFLDVATELSEIPNLYAQNLYDAEFIQA